MLNPAVFQGRVVTLPSRELIQNQLSGLKNFKLNVRFQNIDYFINSNNDQNYFSMTLIDSCLSKARLPSSQL